MGRPVNMCHRKLRKTMDRKSDVTLNMIRSKCTEDNVTRNVSHFTWAKDQIKKTSPSKYPRMLSNFFISEASNGWMVVFVGNA